jgi:hypothetical protein
MGFTLLENKLTKPRKGFCLMIRQRKELMWEVAFVEALNGGKSYNAAMCSEHMVITHLSH